MPRLHPRILFWITTIYWLVLFTATHVPPVHLPNTHVNDKIEHFTAYGLLAGLLFFTLREPNLRKRAVIVLIVCSMYGAFDELTQALPFIHRDCEFNDWLADTIGAAISSTLCFIAMIVVRR